MNQEVAVQLESNNGKTSGGSVTLQSWDKKQRARRALRLWGLCWVLAPVCILIPLLHFFLVPGLILAGPCVAYFIYTQESLITGGSSVCPACSAPFLISKARASWPLRDVCSKCLEHVAINKLNLP